MRSASHQCRNGAGVRRGTRAASRSNASRRIPVSPFFAGRRVYPGGPTVRRDKPAGSPLVGALAFGALGFLAARLLRLRLPWEIAVAATAAALGALLVLGLAVFSGMLGVTLFGIFLTPVFFYVLQGLGRGRGQAPPPEPETGIRAGR